MLIGGAACDILFTASASEFRATRDLDMVLIVEALSVEFAEKFGEFIEAGNYRNKSTGTDLPQFYRFDKPENIQFPKMIELFARTDLVLKEMNGLTPLHIDDEISSLSAILLNDDYYQLLLEGRVVVNELSVLRPEYLILFKARAYLDLKRRKESGMHIDSRDIKKHKNDVLRILSGFVLAPSSLLSELVRHDIAEFVEAVYQDPYDKNQLKQFGITNEFVVERLRNLYAIS
ncbi:MAG: hypothetical protein Q4B01_04710 [Eubacteriales bacterium]|nr:hypothetical protein [Eubacteriales bacterium]